MTLGARFAELAKTHSYGVIAELNGLTRSRVAGLIFRHKHHGQIRWRKRTRFGGRKTGFAVKHKTRFSRWRKPGEGYWHQGEPHG